MAKVVLVVRGDLSVVGAPGVEVIRSPAPETNNEPPNNPTTISEETIMVQEPGSSGMLSLKALKDKIRGGQ